MNVLFVTMSWPNMNQDNMYSDLISEFTDNGHNVCVLAISEVRNNVSTGINYERQCHVIRVRCGNIQKTNKYQKVISSVLAGPKMIKALLRYSPYKQYDVVIWALSTTLILHSVLYAKKHYHAKLYLLLKEYWPQDPCDLGAMKRDGFLYRFFVAIERKMVMTADYIGVCSEAGRKYVTDRYPVNDNIIEVCPNIERKRANLKCNSDEIREKYAIPRNKLVYLYGGNFGVSQGIQDMVACIKAACEANDIVFLLVGSGTEFQYIKDTIGGLEQVIIRNYISQRDFYALCCAVDIGLLFLFKDYNVPNIPGKFSTYLNAGLPIIAAIDKTTDVGHIVENAHCGISMINGDIEAFRNAVNKLKDPVMREDMSLNAGKLFAQNYTTASAYQTIIRHFEYTEEGKL